MGRVDSEQNPIRVAVRVTGIVQGVGFRPFVYRLATQEHVVGFVRNDGLGVYIEAQGKPGGVSRFIERIRLEPPPSSVIFSIESEPIDVSDESTFRIAESAEGASEPLPVSPDLATCSDCLRDIFNRGERRCSYAFTNCTNCGPRFTIVTAVPYDRSNTTMSGFFMCPSCREEYEDPSDRRFHAQPNACPACGPQLELTEPDRKRLRGEAALARAAELLSRGRILAVKGIGGYHLACDARSEHAVAKLRLRKYRYDRPFAIMVRDMRIAEELCFIDRAEEILLASPAAPVVLLPRRRRSSGVSSGDGDVAQSVAPGLERLGIMLPYSPLHHMLLRSGPPVLVMTSGNVSEEPIAFDDDEAATRLKGIADVFLTHNRPIRSRCDDSVAWVPGEGRPQMIRRSRGYAPGHVSLPVEAPMPLLAVGGHYKNTFCLAQGTAAYISHHIGDTSNAEALRSFEDGVKHCKALFSIEPRAVACDMHPEYLTTKYARSLRLQKIVEVQHHHAHVAACMAESGVPAGERVLGVAFDGTGYGPDGTIWGGEFLVCTYSDFERYAHMGYMPLPGGEAAVREPWRLAAFAAQELLGPDFHREPLPLNKFLDGDRWRILHRAVKKGVNAPLCCSVGRFFDCVSALLGVRGSINYEGQAAVELEEAALAELLPPQATRAARLEAIHRVKTLAPYPVGLEAGVIPWEPVVGGVIEDARRGKSPGFISVRFHRTIAEAVVMAARAARTETGVTAVALSGGAFMNEILHCLAVDLLRGDGFKVYTHSKVPANDGGISYGQAVVAAAKLGASLGCDAEV